MTIDVSTKVPVIEPGLERRHQPKALLTAKDLSEQTGWSVSTIYRKRSLGEPLPRAVKIGGHVRWRQADVDAWIEGQLEDQ